MPLPCLTCPKSGKANTPNPGAEMRGKVALAYDLYWQVKAGAPMPEDEIVRRNCALIERVRAMILQYQQDVSGLLAALIAR